MDWAADQPRRVLYVDGEMDVHDLADRTQQLISVLPGIDKDQAIENLQLLAFRDQFPDSWFPDLNEGAHRDWLIETAEEEQVDLVVLDNFSTLVTVEDENAASAMNPILDVMRHLQRLGCAVLLVHHARKNGGGDGSYRGSQKLSVTCNTIIRLEPSPSDAVDGAASFKMVWEKVRARRTEEVHDRQATLSDSGWAYEISNKPELMEYVRMVRSRDYETAESLATALGVVKSTVTKRKQAAVAAGLISMEEVKRCHAEARELQEEDLNEDDDDF